MLDVTGTYLLKDFKKESKIGINRTFYISPLQSSCAASFLVVFSGLPSASAGTKD